MTERWHSTYEIDHAGLARALAALDEPDPNPDYTWQADLPELPPLPEAEAEVVAILIPRAARQRRGPAKPRRAGLRRRG